MRNHHLKETIILKKKKKRENPLSCFERIYFRTTIRHSVRMSYKDLGNYQQWEMLSVLSILQTRNGLFSAKEYVNVSNGLQHTRLLCPWNSPGKNTGVCCHFLLQGSKGEVGRKCIDIVDIIVAVVRSCVLKQSHPQVPIRNTD